MAADALRRPRNPRPAARERELFARLPEAIARAMTAPGWAKQLAGVDPKSVTSRAALAKLPLLRKSDLRRCKKTARRSAASTSRRPARPSGCTCRPARSSSRRDTAADFGGAARALFAAGFRAGDIVHNSFSYHLTPGAYIMEEGAHALGCAVIPGGIGNTEQQLEAIAHYKPSGYVGTPDFLKILLDTAEKAGKDASSIKRGAGLRRGAAGLAARRSWPRAASRCCSATPSPRPA